jgi:hypothetical protein
MKKITILVCFVFLFSAGFVHAQNFFTQDFAQEKTSISLRYIRPDIDSYDITQFSGIYDFSMSLPLFGRLNLVTSLPLIIESIRNINYKNGYINTGGNALGNWFIGAQLRPANYSKSPTSYTLGVFLPTIPAQNYEQSMFGIASGGLEVQKYMIDNLTIYTNVSKKYYLNEDVSLAWEGGPEILIPTNNNSVRNGDLYIHYGFSGVVNYSGYFGAAELTGVALTTSSAEFSDRFYNFASLGFGVNAALHPSIFYQFPLNKTLGNNGVFGLKLNLQVE